MTQSNQPLPGSSVPYDQAGQPAPQLSRRPVVIGVLNLVFAAGYLVLGINATKALDAINQLPSSLRGPFLTAGNLDILADLLAGAGLLIGGILLLMRRQAGQPLTRVVAIVGGLMIVYTACFLVTILSGVSGAYLIGGVLGITLRFAYPILASRILDSSRLPLGLT